MQAKPDTLSNGLANNNMQYTSDPKIQWFGSSSVSMVEELPSVGKAIVRLKSATNPYRGTALQYTWYATACCTSPIEGGCRSMAFFFEKVDANPEARLHRPKSARNEARRT